jgi:hypothetical protein
MREVAAAATNREKGASSVESELDLVANREISCCENTPCRSMQEPEAIPLFAQDAHLGANQTKRLISLRGLHKLTHQTGRLPRLGCEVYVISLRLVRVAESPQISLRQKRAQHPVAKSKVVLFRRSANWKCRRRRAAHRRHYRRHPGVFHW